MARVPLYQVKRLAATYLALSLETQVPRSGNPGFLNDVSGREMLATPENPEVQPSTYYCLGPFRVHQDDRLIAEVGDHPMPEKWQDPRS